MNWDYYRHKNFIGEIAQMSSFITQWRISKGFHTPHGFDTEKERDQMLGKLMLIVSEVSEASEAVRKDDMFEFREEIADTFIRLFDICGSVGLNIGMDIIGKMQINEERPQKHGKECSL